MTLKKIIKKSLDFNFNYNLKDKSFFEDEYAKENYLQIKGNEEVGFVSEKKG